MHENKHLLYISLLDVNLIR